MLILGSGTSQGVPVIGCSCEVCTSKKTKDNRLRVSAYITYKDTKILIDVGPDFRMQFLRANLSDVDAVLLTHEHNDHIAGMDDLRPINFLHQKSIPIYAEQRVIKKMETSFGYIFDASYYYPGKPRLTLNPISEDSFTIGDLEIIPIRVMHGQLPIMGFRFGDMCYLTDVKTVSLKEQEKLKGLDTLVINALHHSAHHSHLNLEEAIEFISKVNPKQAYLSHISHRMGLHDKIDKTLPKGINLAYDGLLIN